MPRQPNTLTLEELAERLQHVQMGLEDARMACLGTVHAVGGVGPILLDQAIYLLKLAAEQGVLLPLAVQCYLRNPR